MSQPTSRRRRGVILTALGWQKFQAAKSKAEVADHAGERYTLEQLSDRTHLSVDTLMRILGGTVGVDRLSLHNCFRAFNLRLEPEDYTLLLPQPIEPESGPVDRLSPQPPVPGGQLPVDSGFYIERAEIEANCYRAIAEPGAMLRIKAAHQMGKTSLIARILNHATELGYQTVLVQFQLAPKDCLHNMEQLLRWFCGSLSSGLALPNQVDAYWDATLGSKVSSMHYVEQCILNQMTQPIVVAIDEMNQLFQSPDLTQEFLGLLRTWYEAARNHATWQRLRLVIAYSNEMVLSPSRYHSPLSVGVPIDLMPFTPDQIHILAQRYGIPASVSQIEQLTTLVQGHPCLVQVALYHLWQQNLSWEQLFQTPLTRLACFRDYLPALPDTSESPRLTPVLDCPGQPKVLDHDTLQASVAGLAIVDVARHRKGWSKVWSSAWWQTAQTNQATLRQFWQGQPIPTQAFVGTCQAVDLNWEDIADWIPEQPSQTIAPNRQVPHTHHPWDETTAIAPMGMSYVDRVLPELPEGLVRLGSPLYIQRSVEARCYTTIAQAGALIRIKAPRQMGKTSLMARIVHHAKTLGYRTVRLNLCQAEEPCATNLNHFLRWFSACLSQKLHLSACLDDYWDTDRGSIFNCTTYVQDHILEQIRDPIVIALDDVDHVFQSPDISQGFLAMLRLWYEEAKTTECWEQVRLIIAHSTEDYGRLDIHQSPLNVGLPVELEEFTPEQVSYLVTCQHLDRPSYLVQPLMALVGGHPYLINLALYHLACQDISLERLLAEAATNTGIYEDHLRRHLVVLQQQPDLAAAFYQVVTAPDPVALETMYTYQLYSMGLLRRQFDAVIPRCELYRQYFRDRLSS